VIEEFTHEGFAAVAVERSVLQLQSKSMGFISPQNTITPHRS
jgi:hypothetical protein